MCLPFAGVKAFQLDVMKYRTCKNILLKYFSRRTVATLMLFFKSFFILKKHGSKLTIVGGMRGDELKILVENWFINFEVAGFAIQTVKLD